MALASRTLVRPLERFLDKLGMTEVKGAISVRFVYASSTTAREKKRRSRTRTKDEGRGRQEQ